METGFGLFLVLLKSTIISFVLFVFKMRWLLPHHHITNESSSYSLYLYSASCPSLTHPTIIWVFLEMTGLEVYWMSEVYRVKRRLYSPLSWGTPSQTYMPSVTQTLLCQVLFKITSVTVITVTVAQTTLTSLTIWTSANVSEVSSNRSKTSNLVSSWAKLNCPDQTVLSCGVRGTLTSVPLQTQTETTQS